MVDRYNQDGVSGRLTGRYNQDGISGMLSAGQYNQDGISGRFIPGFYNQDGISGNLTLYTGVPRRIMLAHVESANITSGIRGSEIRVYDIADYRYIDHIKSLMLPIPDYDFSKFPCRIDLPIVRASHNFLYMYLTDYGEVYSGNFLRYWVVSSKVITRSEVTDYITGLLAAIEAVVPVPLWLSSFVSDYFLHSILSLMTSYETFYGERLTFLIPMIFWYEDGDKNKQIAFSDDEYLYLGITKEVSGEYQFNLRVFSYIDTSSDDYHIPGPGFPRQLNGFSTLAIRHISKNNGQVRAIYITPPHSETGNRYLFICWEKGSGLLVSGSKVGFYIYEITDLEALATEGGIIEDSPYLIDKDTTGLFQVSSFYYSTSVAYDHYNKIIYVGTKRVGVSGSGTIRKIDFSDPENPIWITTDEPVNALGSLSLTYPEKMKFSFDTLVDPKLLVWQDYYYLSYFSAYNNFPLSLMNIVSAYTPTHVGPINYDASHQTINDFEIETDTVFVARQNRIISPYHREILSLAYDPNGQYDFITNPPQVTTSDRSHTSFLSWLSESDCPRITDVSPAAGLEGLEPTIIIQFRIIDLPDPGGSGVNLSTVLIKIAGEVVFRGAFGFTSNYSSFSTCTKYTSVTTGDYYDFYIVKNTSFLLGSRLFIEIYAEDFCFNILSISYSLYIRSEESIPEPIPEIPVIEDELNDETGLTDDEIKDISKKSRDLRRKAIGMGRIGKTEEFITKILPQYITSVKGIVRGVALPADPFLLGRVRFSRKVGGFMAILVPDNQMRMSNKIVRGVSYIEVERISPWMRTGLILEIEQKELVQVLDYEFADNVVNMTNRISLTSDIAATGYSEGSLIDIWGAPVSVTVAVSVGSNSITVKSSYPIFIGDKISILCNDALLGSYVEHVVTSLTTISEAKDNPVTADDYYYFYTVNFAESNKTVIDLIENHVVYLRCYPAYLSSMMPIPQIGVNYGSLGPLLFDSTSALLLDRNEELEEYMGVQLYDSMKNKFSTELVSTGKNYLVKQLPIKSDSFLLFDKIYGLLNYANGSFLAGADENGKFAIISQLVPEITAPMKWIFSVEPTCNASMRVRLWPNDAQEFQLTANTKTSYIVELAEGDEDATKFEINILFDDYPATCSISDFTLQGSRVSFFRYSLMSRVNGDFSWGSTGLLIKPLFLNLDYIKSVRDYGSGHNTGFVRL